MVSQTQDDELLKLRDLGFRSPKFFHDDHWAAIIHAGSFFAIVDGNRTSLVVGYINRWNYGTLKAATDALDGWDGAADPKGYVGRVLATVPTVWP